MSTKLRIVVAMSGGVDSSTVAGLLVEAGHEVIGLAMKTHGEQPKQNRACCTPDDMRDARRVADHLDIPFYILNYQDVFREQVILPFAQAYKEGRTPNPCVECNDKVKFRPLLERARLLDADFLATGHYARIIEQNGQRLLQRGVDPQKDQSYFLYRLDQAQLAQLIFPIGGMTKPEVRAHAERLGLPVAQKHESQEICFVGAEGYAKTVEKILGEGGARGKFVDTEGKVLGEHDGIHHFTLGQRRGLRIAASDPLYVLDINAASGNVVVGGAAQLQTSEVELVNTTWSVAPPVGEEVLLQQRYRQTPRKARLLEVLESSARFVFVEPEQSGAPGQAAVVYQGDNVLGGGAIAMKKREAAYA